MTRYEQEIDGVIFEWESPSGWWKRDEHTQKVVFDSTVAVFQIETVLHLVHSQNPTLALFYLDYFHLRTKAIQTSPQQR